MISVLLKPKKIIAEGIGKYTLLIYTMPSANDFSFSTLSNGSLILSVTEKRQNYHREGVENILAHKRVCCMWGGSSASTPNKK